MTQRKSGEQNVHNGSVTKGAPGNMSKPDAHNDFGKVHKQGASCKS